MASEIGKRSPKGDSSTSDQPGPQPRPKFKPPAPAEISPKSAGVLQKKILK